MRRLAVVLVLLLTATAAQAGYEDGRPLEVLVYGMACCATVPFLFMLSSVIAAIIYDLRKARRTKAPAENE